MDAMKISGEVTYRRPSAYPAMSRTLRCGWPAAKQLAAVKGTLTTAAGPLLVRDTLFDTFERMVARRTRFRLSSSLWNAR